MKLIEIYFGGDKAIVSTDFIYKLINRYTAIVTYFNPYYEPVKNLNVNAPIWCKMSKGDEVKTFKYCELGDNEDEIIIYNR